METGVDFGAEPNVQQDAQSEDEEEAQAAAIFALDVLAHSLVSSWERTASVCIIHLFLFLPPPPPFPLAFNSCVISFSSHLNISTCPSGTTGPKKCVCVFITAVPITKLFEWGGGKVEDMSYERLRAEACEDESAHHALVNAGERDIV